jgi:hypothetical protein
MSRPDLDAIRADADRLVGESSAALTPGWTEAPDPLALIGTRAPAYPTDALAVIPNAAEWVAEAARSCHVAEALTGTYLLGAVSAVVGGRFDVATSEAHAIAHPITGTLYVVGVAPPGEGKSRALNLATRDLADLRESWEEEHAADLAQHDALHALLAAEAATGDGFAAQRLAEHDALRPVPPFTVYSDLTPEALQQATAEGPVAVITAEMAEMIAPLLGGGKGAAPRFGVVTSAWSGEEYHVRRATQAARRSRRPRVVIVGGIQPTVLGSLLADHAAIQGQGLLGRVLLASSPARLGERDMRAAPMDPGMRYVAANILQSAMRAAADVDPTKGAPCILGPDALAVHVAWSADDIEPRRHPTGDLGGVPDFTARLEEHALRIAVTLHAAQGLGVGTRITVDTITAAQRLAEHYAAERIALNVTGDDPRTVVADALAVLGWRQRNPTASAVTAREVLQGGLRRQVPTGARITAALRRLERAGYAREHGDGPRASRWTFHPDALRYAPDASAAGRPPASNPPAEE